MSASAPLGRPSRKTGKVEAVCTRATSTGEVVSEVIIQAAATSFIHMQILAASVTPQSMRKLEEAASGAQVDTGLLAWGERLCGLAGSSSTWPAGAGAGAGGTGAAGPCAPEESEEGGGEASDMAG